MLGASPNSANEQAHVRTLTTTIRVQLIKNQKANFVVDCLSQSSLPPAREEQLQHHVVREENVRRFNFQFLATSEVFLAGELCKSNREFLSARLAEVLCIAPQLLFLRVQQRI